MSQRHLKGSGCAVAPARPRLGAHPSAGNGLTSSGPHGLASPLLGAGAPHGIAGAPACA